jgi:thioesterase domain-containing protein
MAQDYLEVLSPLLNKGQVILAGASMGGKVAYEMARILETQNRPVPLVVMFDSRILPLRNENDLISRVRFHQQKLTGFTFLNKLKYIIQKTRTKLRRRVYSIFIRRGHPLPPCINQIGTISYLVSKFYRPKPYNGRVVLLRAEELAPGTPNDPFNGWEITCTSGLEIKSIDSSHTSILKEPAVTWLAEEMQKLLEEISGESTS